VRKQYFEVIKSAIRERPPRRIIDLVKVELDEGLGSGVYWASLITANIHDVRIATDLVTRPHQTGGYAATSSRTS
jgi:predicted ATP-dependent Lon-type protease